MMNRIKKRKRIAVVFLVIWITDGCLPYVSYALTSGPSAPEVQAFQPAGVTDLVDLKSGDFKYNIPLLDVDGYPLNLSYQSGSSMDDEASWVGAGWSLNTGSINRQVRGVPDDMSGDAVETDHWTKPMVTTGGRVTAKTELFGSNLISGSASLSYGVYSNNYTGFGVELSANIGMSMSKPSDGFLTGGLGLGISSDSQKGVDATPYASLSITEKCKDKSMVSSGLSASLGYNTRTGLKSLSLGASFSVNGFQSSELGHIGGNYSYNTEPISPRINIPYLNTSSTFSIDGGFSFAGVFLGGGVAGYRTERRVLKPQLFTPSYGFLYAENGKNNPNAQMDFIRENENPVILELPNLAVPVQMPDMFSYTSQAGSGQFRLYRGGSGIFFDNQADDKTASQTAGIDLGVGPTDIHGGVTLFKQDMHATTHKWVKDNNYISNGDFQDQDKVTPGNQHAYFKQMGDMSAQDVALAQSLGYTQPVMPSVTGNRADGNFVGMTAQTIKKTSRQPGKTSISYLTADQATFGGLNPTLDDYAFIDAGAVPATLPAKPVTTNKYLRRDPTLTDLPAPNAAAQLSFGDAPLDKDEYPARKDHHISEMTVTDDGGKRMVYGLPVYNMKQDEYSFAIGKLGPDYSIVNGNQMVPTFGSGQPGTNKGIDNYYQKETKPPYASSFLLTAILSPDYVDKTGDGITDDDQGTALKFNYSRLPYLYNWRAPYQNATVNRGLLADPDDDKASIVFGKKEIWYVHSIETKTKIVYFITKNRNDGVGASDNWASGGQNTAQRQKCLTEIRLYSKANMSKPIKVVKFQYDYTLCNKVPNYNDPANSTAVGGKLTLKKVWFEYQNIDRGKYHPYVFTYNTTSTGNSLGEYSYMSTDRWGVFKTKAENLDPTLTNEEYPYTDQNNNRSVINSNVGLFQLNRIDLPTGGDIVVNYESDDYAYVQNRRAMAMSKITAFIKDVAHSGVDVPTADPNFLYEAAGVRVAVPSTSMPASTITGPALLSWFQANFLDGSQYLYTKTYVNLQTGNSTPPVGSNTWDFIPCYAKVASVEADYTTNTMKVYFETITDGGVTANPIVNAVWQRMKNEYPRYAYPGFDNKSDGSLGSGMLSIINATINAATNFRELFKSFYTIARDGNYGMKVDFSHSFVRLTKTDGPTVNSNVVISKAGGGLRVSKIMIDDNWKTLSGDNDAGKLATYGQAYDYTTIENNKLISSGVAAYEPSIGADENPFKQPVPYIQKIKGAINNYFDLEEPFGESVFPSPSVTYSKVTVTDLNQNHVADPLKQTGYQVSEFYTSKDFPVRVNVLKIIPNHQPGSSFFSLIKTTSDDELFMSQGYSVELNDMDGRPKAERSFSQAGTQIAATEYYYKSTDVGGGEYALNNSVQVLNPDGTIATKTMGQDIELFTDFREQESINKGTAVNVGTEFLYIFAFGVLLPHIPISLNDDYRLFRSACAFKVIQSSGILDHVVKIQNGSSITTQNIAFDGETGEALITETQNEFNKNIYSVNIPAYWAYPGMSGAYQNAGVVLSGLTTDNTGIIGSQVQFLDSGDELVDLDDTKPPYDSMVPAARARGAHYWVVEEVGRTGGIGGFYDNKYLMNRFGQIQTNFTSPLVKMVRPGNRNVLTPGITQIVCLNNPITADNHLQLVNNTDLTSALKVINATATTFDESWASEPPDIHALQGTSPFNLSVQGGGEIVNSVQPVVYLNNNTYGANKNFTNNDFNASMIIPGNYFVNRSVISSITDPGTNTLFSRTDNNLMGLFATFYAPRDGVYFVGFDSNFKMSFRFDTPPANVCNTGWFSLDSHSDPGKWGWNIVPVTLKKGLRTINIEMSYRGYDPGSSYMQKGGGIEVYDNSQASEITSYANSGTGLNVIFSTKDLINNQAPSNVYTINNGKTYYEQYYTDGPHTAFTPCTVPSNAINPYIYGYRGNWRPYKTKVFEENRVYENILNQTSNKVNIANAGFINNFFTDWFYQASSGSWIENPNTTRWVTSNSVTLYDKFGQQLENKDALGRYSSAQFDFNGQLPGTVASNAMSRELYVNSFEDTRFTPGGTIYADASPNHEFLSSTGSSIDSYATRGVYHTGNYSAALPVDGLTISTLGHGLQNKTVDYLSYDLSHQYIKSGAANIYPKGFEPAAKKYLFDVWVKDGKPNDRSFVGITVAASINFTVSPVINVPVSLTVKAQIEDWKLIEGTMDLSHLSDNDGVSPPYGGPGAPLTISIVPAAGAGQVYLDDIRIHPYDSQIKSYAYDDQTMRLMAEIDENGFATLYEYDAQGLLVRVKKETEKGIVTLKESRSSYKKIP